MKIEIEISDESIKEQAQKYVAAGLSHQGYSGNWIGKLVEERVKAHFQTTDFSVAIKERIREKVQGAIDRAIDQKLDGWIKRQISECLKAADLMSRALPSQSAALREDHLTKE